MKIAVVLVRGIIGANIEVKDTLRLLNLHKKNMCVILDKNLSNLGMIRKVKDFVTWGDIDEDTIKKLDTKREKDKKFVRLNPPRKGFGRKGIKMPFSKRGALGDRGEKINDLLNRML